MSSYWATDCEKLVANQQLRSFRLRVQQLKCQRRLARELFVMSNEDKRRFLQKEF